MVSKTDSSFYVALSASIQITRDIKMRLMSMLHNICKVKNVADILRNFEVVI